MKQNLTKFEHAGADPVGCGNGVHLYDNDRDSPTGPRLNITNEVDERGEPLTAMILTCLRCTAQITINTPLGMNDDIKKAEQADKNHGIIQSQPTPRHIPQPDHQPQEDIPEPKQNDKVLKKLFG